MAEWLILKSGLILNLFGTLLIAFAIRANPEEAYQTYKGRKAYLASVLHPRCFWVGVALLMLGFLLSILDTALVKVLVEPRPN